MKRETRATSAQILATYGPGGVPRSTKHEGTPIYTAVRAFVVGLCPGAGGVRPGEGIHPALGDGAALVLADDLDIAAAVVRGVGRRANAAKIIWAVLRKLLHINIRSSMPPRRRARLLNGL
jgi:hypothetical protein